MATTVKRQVGVSTPTEDVIKWDTDGDRLVFDEKDFHTLPKDIVLGLSNLNKSAYFITKGIYDLENDPEAGEVTEDYLVSPEALRNQASNLLNVEVQSGLNKYHAAPSDIASFRKQGFRVATKADLLHAEDEASLDIRNGGYTELRMMVRSKELSAKYKAAKRKRDQELKTGRKIDDPVMESTAELERLGAGKSFGTAEFTEE